MAFRSRQRPWARKACPRWYTSVMGRHHIHGMIMLGSSTREIIQTVMLSDFEIEAFSNLGMAP
jgi:hypothetical protein